METGITTTQGRFDCSETHDELALSYLESFKQSGERCKLERSITHHRIALKLCPEGHLDRSRLLHNLAVSLSMRYRRWGQLECLEEVIRLNRAALELRPEGHPFRSISLNNLANYLRTRYDQHGRMEDLEESIELHRAALALRPEGHPDRSTSLNNLANSLSIRYEQQGRTNDIEEAIELYRAALEPSPEGYHAHSLSNLANSLRIRYEQQGRTDDLEEAIELHRTALDLLPKGHPDRSMSLNNLANSLRTRCRQQGRSKDLDEAIELYRAALELRPKGHPDHSMSLINLAVSLGTRSEQQGRTKLKDLEEAIKLDRAALELLPEGHPHRYNSLNNLAGSLTIRYEQRGGTKYLEEAIELHRAALELRPEGYRARFLVNLAKSLRIRYERHGMIKDLEEAIELGRTALELRPEGHPGRSSTLRSLACSLYARIEKQQDLEGFEECMRLLELAATHEFSGLLDRLPAAQHWAMLARRHRHDKTFSAYRMTLSILQQALTIRPTLLEQHDILAEENVYRLVTFEAASYAIEENELEQAVEILEQGRGLLWSQLRGLRTPLDQLAETNKGLADRFRDINGRLENLATSQDSFMSGSSGYGGELVNLDGKPGQKSFDELLKIKKQLSHEQKGIINEIRRVPGFESFLQVTPFKDLQRAASEGPIVMVNHSKYRSDALIVLFCDDPSVICVPLDKQFYEDSIKLCDELVDTRKRLKSHPLEYEKKLCEVMNMLWGRAVSKIVGKLTEFGIAKKSRIWWCPTSVLSALPFHAAGPFKDSDGTTKYLLDDYISSYTPTLNALINARSNTSTSEPKLLVVGDTVTLSSTRQEIRNIRICMSNYESKPKILLNNKASQHTVMEILQEITWVHFACHGHLDPKPFNSSFKLTGGGLTLLDIIRGNVRDAEFAFLSACHTAELSHSGVHDEALHLSAAMQFSGFRSVIGTMWELYDGDGPAFARVVYEYMNNCEEGESRYKRAAGGLREAALELKAREGIPTERWVNFVHIGA